MAPSSSRNCLKIGTIMTPAEIAQLIQAALPQSRVDIRSDDNTHFSARLIGPEFEGLRSLARHQLIYRALGERMGREIHALTIEAYTPQEWAARAQQDTSGRG
jgi:acid stress-induced BolA-like protein IbaG/YrbA